MTQTEYYYNLAIIIAEYMKYSQYQQYYDIQDCGTYGGDISLEPIPGN